MMHAQQIEELIMLVNSLDKPALMRQFGSYQTTFPVDFTPDFLQDQPVDRLRHLFVALCLHAQRMPEIPANAA